MTKDMDKLSVAREAAARLKPPLRIDALNEIMAGVTNFSAMILRDEDPSCAAIIAQNLTDQDARDIVTIVNTIAALTPAPQPAEVAWQPIETAPKDGKRMAAQGRDGKLHIIYANPELDRSLFVCWSRPPAAAIRGGAE